MKTVGYVEAVVIYELSDATEVLKTDYQAAINIIHRNQANDYHPWVVALGPKIKLLYD